MQKLPQINYWREPVTRPGHAVAGEPIVYACHACRNWDMPSNGVFLLFTSDELWGRSARTDWRRSLKEALETRERRLIREYERKARHHFTEYFDDEIWVPA